MLGITLLLCGPLGPFGVDSPASRQSFELVKKLDSTPSERERVQRELTNRPSAVWAVFWGSQHGNLEISTRCASILDSWRAQARLAAIVRGVDADFDRFINHLLYSPGRDLKAFEPASQAGRALDGYLMKHLASLTENDIDPRSPFHEFPGYVSRQKPLLFFKDLFELPRREEPKCYLAKCDRVKAFELYRSIVLSEGNVAVDSCSGSLVISGGDVTVGGTVASLIIASGNVTFTGGTVGHVFVIAGGKVTMGSSAVGALLISPKKLAVAASGNLTRPIVILDGKRKPAPAFFAFRDLWTDDGLEANVDQVGRLRITKVRSDSTLAKYFKTGDVVLSLAKKKVESVGQFRRLLGYGYDVGRLDFQIERGGKPLNIQADLTKDAGRPR